MEIKLQSNDLSARLDTSNILLLVAKRGDEDGSKPTIAFILTRWGSAPCEYTITYDSLDEFDKELAMFSKAGVPTTSSKNPFIGWIIDRSNPFSSWTLYRNETDNDPSIKSASRAEE